MLAAARVADPVAARSQMGFSLGWHIILACFGVGLPALILFTEWRGLRTGDPAYRCWPAAGPRRWACCSRSARCPGRSCRFEMGLLWPGLMGNYGQVIGLPFAIEGIAFFIEAIFLGHLPLRLGPAAAPRRTCCPASRSSSPAWLARSSWSPRTRG